MKLVFIFAIGLFVVYGVEGCFLLDMAARSLGSMLAPPAPRPQVIVINARRNRPPPPEPVVYNTVYRPPRIGYGIGTIGGGIAVARPKLLKLKVSSEVEPPSINYEIGAETLALKPERSRLLDIFGGMFSPPSGGVKIQKPQKKTQFARKPLRFGNDGREKKGGKIILSNVKNNQNIKLKSPKRPSLLTYPGDGESSEEWKG